MLLGFMVFHRVAMVFWVSLLLEATPTTCPQQLLYRTKGKVIYLFLLPLSLKFM
jgi:hypothetical protein